ncbi:DUF7620 family protein [Amycolatopsis japonica]
MSWLRKLLNRDNDLADLDQRVEDAQRQRAEAAEIRTAAEIHGPRNRRHVEDNNFGERFRAAFEARRRHA